MSFLLGFHICDKFANLRIEIKIPLRACAHPVCIHTELICKAPASKHMIVRSGKCNMAL